MVITEENIFVAMPAQGQKSWYVCSHSGCGERLPGSHQGQEIPPGWTVARLEEHGKTTIKCYYLYLCSKHVVASASRQTNLF